MQEECVVLTELHRHGVPVSELFGSFGHSLFREAMFAMFTGYIDDSGNSKIFTLSCLVGDAPMWMWIEFAWKNLLEKTNKSLAAQGRKQISRYKAADCSSCLGEFSGWTRDEQIELSKGILQIFQRHPLNIIAYNVNLLELMEEIPETKPDPYGFAYVMLLTNLMTEIGDFTLKQYPTDKIALIHDRGDYDAVLLEAFNHLKEDPYFKYRDQFVTIAPMGWEDCIPLQPADLLAYENFKEVERETTGRNRRKILAGLLDLDSFSGRAKGLERPYLRELRKVVDNLDETTKEILLTNARVRRVQRTRGRDSESVPQGDKKPARPREKGKEARN